MFHTPPTNPDRCSLVTTATLESYGNQAHDEHEPESVNPPKDSSGSPISVTSMDSGKTLDNHKSGTNETLGLMSDSSNEGSLLQKNDQKDDTSKTITQSSEVHDNKHINMEYVRDLQLVQLPKKLDDSITEFLNDLQAPKYSQPLTTDQVSELFQQFYARFDQSALEYLKKKEDDEIVIEKIHNDYMEKMESKLCGNKIIFPKIFQNDVDDLKIQINIYEKTYVLRNVIKLKLEKLDMELKDFENLTEEVFKKELNSVEKLFNRANYLTSPLEKLVTFSKSFDELMKIISKYKKGYISADVAFPIFIFTMVHKHVENLFLNFKFIKRFKYEKFWTNELNGQYSYFMTNIEALLTFITRIAYKKDLNLTDEGLFNCFERYKQENLNCNNNEGFKELKILNETTNSELNQKSKKFQEKKKLLDKLNEFNNNEDENITLFDGLKFEDLKKILSPCEISLFNYQTTLPLPKNVPLTSSSNRVRKKSNSITFIKNTLHESINHYHNNLSPTSSNSSNSIHNYKLIDENTGKPMTLSDAAQISGGLVLNVADQGIKNLSSVFDSSLKFIGNRISSNSIPTINTTNVNSDRISNSANSNTLGSFLTSNNNGNRSRSNSGNSFIANTRNRSNSTLNSIFNGNNNNNNNKILEEEKNIHKPLDIRELDVTNVPQQQHPLNKFMKWRSGSTSNINSPSASNLSFNITNESQKASPTVLQSNSITPPLTQNPFVENHKNFKKINKDFDELNIGELRQLYQDYNNLVGYINNEH